MLRGNHRLQLSWFGPLDQYWGTSIRALRDAPVSQPADWRILEGPRPHGRPGTGISKMLKLMRLNGSLPLVFETDDDRTYCLARLPLHPVFIKEAEERKGKTDRPSHRPKSQFRFSDFASSLAKPLKSGLWLVSNIGRRSGKITSMRFSRRAGSRVRFQTSQRAGCSVTKPPRKGKNGCRRPATALAGESAHFGECQS